MFFLLIKKRRPFCFNFLKKESKESENDPKKHSILVYYASVLKKNEF